LHDEIGVAELELEGMVWMIDAHRMIGKSSNCPSSSLNKNPKYRKSVEVHVRTL
jgi:hypothetical protein